MTPEITLLIKTPAIYYMFLQRHNLYNEFTDNCPIGVLIIENCISIAKCMITGDTNGVEKIKLELLEIFIKNNIVCGIDEVNEMLAVTSESIMVNLMLHDLVDYVQYVMDIKVNKIVLRIYKLDINIDHNKGITEIL